MKNKLWSDDTTFLDIKKDITSNLDCCINMDSELLSQSISSFNSLEENDRIVDFCKYVDSINYGDKTLYLKRNIPTILGGAFIINNFTNNTDLTDECLAALSHFISVGDVDYVKESFYAYDSRVLKEVCKKGNSWLERDSILEVVE